MARSAWLAAWAVVLGCGPSLFAADLTKIDRTIGRLPQFKTAAQDYCLLVFGPEAATRVWLVRDGDVLYVDRNGNGDLTEPDERAQADRNTSHPDEDQFIFKVGSIREGALEHKDLVVFRNKIDYLRDRDSKVRELLDREPTARGHRLQLDVEMPGRTGTGIGGRVTHLVSTTDAQGVLQFAARREDAPIIHFGGPWQVALTADEDKFKVGQTRKVYLAMGTPGLGPGTTAMVGYEGVIPPELNATLKFTFPGPVAEQSRTEKSYVLAQRCCTVNIYGDVAVPENVGTGAANVEISLPGWPGTTVAPSTHTVEILAALPRPQLEPVSARLKGSLPHSNPKGDVCAIQFSPDGQRLIAGDYPGGIVHVWDVASGKRLSTFDAGQGLRSTMEYFAVSPDWRTLYAPHHRKQKYERIERDGKVLHRFEFNDEIRVWDLASGDLLRTVQHAPPRRIVCLEMSPAGTHLLTLDELSGEYDGPRARATSLWDVATGTPSETRTDANTTGLFSPDGKSLALTIFNSPPDDYHRAIQLFEVSPWKEAVTIKLPPGLILAYSSLFCSQGKVLIGKVSRYEKRDDYQDYETRLTFWDTTTGNELFSVTPSEKKTSFSFVTASPDGQTVAAAEYRQDNGPMRLHLIDIAQRRSRIVNVGDDFFLREPLFHPNGQWLAIPVQHYPKEMFTNPDPDPEDCPQPRVQIIDIPSGQILETLVLPKAHVLSAAFSPDGKTLATASYGEVLLWDMTAPLGEKKAGSGER